jgi:hypothetical protein
MEVERRETGGDRTREKREKERKSVKEGERNRKKIIKFRGGGEMRVKVRKQ